MVQRVLAVAACQSVNVALLTEGGSHPHNLMLARPTAMQRQTHSFARQHSFVICAALASWLRSVARSSKHLGVQGKVDSPAAAERAMQQQQQDERLVAAMLLCPATAAGEQPETQRMG